jgi:protein phosphatase PTC1
MDLKLWDVCSDQEAVDLVRNNLSPQAASKVLVDHALSRFSTDNLSVMIVRFDSKKLQSNISGNIGVEDNKIKGPSEVEVIVSEARRKSGIEDEAAGQDDGESEELKNIVMKQIQEEDHEPGPELTPEGLPDAEKVYVERSKGPAQNK